MENIRNRVDVRLVNNKKNTIFEIGLKTNLSNIHKKTAYLRICILELSKLVIYEFHYDYINSKYCNKSRLLFTDTDSLVYETETENFYEDFSKNADMLGIHKISLYCFDDKIHVLDNEIYVLALGA